MGGWVYYNPCVWIVSGWYILNQSTFCNQAWYDDASLSDEVTCRKMDVLTSSSRSQWRLHNQNIVSTVSSKLLILLQPNLLVHCHKPECHVWILDGWCLRSRSQWRFKILVPVCPDDIYWTTEPFVTKLSRVLHHHEVECHVQRFLC